EALALFALPVLVDAGVGDVGSVGKVHVWTPLDADPRRRVPLLDHHGAGSTVVEGVAQHVEVDRVTRAGYIEDHGHERDGPALGEEGVTQCPSEVLTRSQAHGLRR